MACFAGQLLAPAEGFDQGQNAAFFFVYFLPILVFSKNQEKLGIKFQETIKTKKN